MRRLTTVIIVAGAAMFVALLWSLDLSSMRVLVFGAGWGLAVIVGQEIVAHALNAVGWRLASTPDYARAVPFARLVQLRIAGDAINYLTPTATLGGEVSRIGMLRRRYGRGGETASVVIAKLAQTLAQALFVAAGVAFVVRARLDPTRLAVAAAALGVVGMLLVATLLWPRIRRMLARSWNDRAGFLGRHPYRFAAATVTFLAAYAWGMAEAYVICRCLGLGVSLSTVFALETLSAGVDGLLFMVPAKIGTQEGGKAAIFAALGLSPTAGFAFGLLRHARELAWAAAGLAIAALWWRHRPAAVAALWAAEGERPS
jgi:glycosyltransferase 2 family protein